MEPFAPVAGRAVARLGRQLELALVSVELTPPQYRILALLAEGSAAATAIARRLAVSPPSVTAIVDGLVARGLVARERDEADRRRVSHGLTDAGRALLDAADAAVSTRLGEIAAHAAGPADAALLHDGLAAWQRALDRYREAKLAADAGVRA